MAIRRIRKLKPHRLTKPKFLSFVAYTLILFLWAVIVSNINPDANSEYRKDWEKTHQQPMQWVFLADNGQKYTLGENPFWEHGAPETYEYMLPGTGSLLSESEQKNEQKADSGFLTGAQNTNVAKSYKNAYTTLLSTLEDRSHFINKVFEFLVRGDIVELPEWSVRYVVAMYEFWDEARHKVLDGASCMTPWGYSIDDWASVLAYQQRSDTPSICNIQRRTCKNGKLSGQFTQSSCNESKQGKMKKTDFSTYNADPNPKKELQWDILAQEKRREYLEENWYIQPDAPYYKNAQFNLNGKRAPNPAPTTQALAPNQPTKDDVRDVPLSPDGKKYCTAPWWEKVKSGQFVKAYRFRNGFSDIPCQVQLRLCVDGELEWTYQNPSCQPWETSYEDFLDGYMNQDQPSPRRLLRMLQTEFIPEPEYGNTLTQPVALEMKKVMNSDF